jgi:hypothetical protein
LTLDRIRFMSGCVLFIALLAAAASFLTTEQGVTCFGTALGVDYIGFYSAATILNRHSGDRLYDFDLQYQYYHEFIPGATPEERLPHLHPPFISLALRPLAALPYPWSFGVWLCISAGLYVAGVHVLLKLVPALSFSDRITVVLLALSFQPFIMEAWLGGQLSAVGMLCIAVAIWLSQQRRPVAAGLALGLCLYKPTLLVLLLPMLVATRQWRILAGVGITAAGLAAISLVGVGWHSCLTYIRLTFGFARSTLGTEGMILRGWKYVDLNSFFRLLIGDEPVLNAVLVSAIAVPALLLLAAIWWRLGESKPLHASAWATALAWTPIANLYLGVYDSIVIVPAILLILQILLARAGAALSLPAGFKFLLVLLCIVPWFSQPLALATNVQVFTPVLLANAIYLLSIAWRTRTEAEVV